MTKVSERAKILAEYILREKQTRTYRQIAGEFPRRADGTQIVKAGTLNRIAKSGGRWYPKDLEIMRALGLRESRAPLTELQKKIRRMARETKKKVLRDWRLETKD